MKYCAEIDGLRALAVVPVILFHAGFELFSGGFVGVDVFFVISGYFSAAAQENPLLHTWSLAIEEQYYVLFPIFLFLAWRFGKKGVFWIIVVFAAASLTLSEWGWRNAPSTNFYLAPARAWELFAGSIAAFIVQKRGVQPNNALSLLGLAAILGAIFVYDENTPFPSVYALVPVFGVMLLILYAEKETFVAQLLSIKLLVGLGLISYSAYLWHQPLFAFARISSPETPSAKLMAALALMAVGLAYLTFRYIETPFRNREKIRHSQFVIILTCVFAALMTVGIGGQATDGYQSLMLAYKYTEDEKDQYRLVSDATDYDPNTHMYASECQMWVRNTVNLDLQQFNACRVKYGKALVVLGDSYAMNLYNIVAKSGAFDFVVGVSQGGCRPQKNLDNCHYDDFDRFLGDHGADISKVIYHQSGSYFIKDINGKVDSQFAFEGGFESFDRANILDTLGYLEKMADAHGTDVLWIGPFLEYRYRPLSVVGADKSASVNPLSKELFERLGVELKEITASSRKIDSKGYPEVFFEPVAAYHGACFVFRDTDHYSRCGENLVAEKSNLRVLGE